MPAYGRVIDRVYALIHDLESRMSAVPKAPEEDDFLEGVLTGQRAERRELLDRLRWVLDPEKRTKDIRDVEKLVRLLNEDR